MQGANRSLGRIDLGFVGHHATTVGALLEFFGDAVLTQATVTGLQLGPRVLLLTHLTFVPLGAHRGVSVITNTYWVIVVI